MGEIIPKAPQKYISELKRAIFKFVYDMKGIDINITLIWISALSLLK